MNETDVFISHVEEDADCALEIALGLEERGFTTWCYEVDSVPGVSYLIQTGQAIDRTQALVLLISKHSMNSRQVTKELERAHESEKDVIPVLRDVSHQEFQKRQQEWRQILGAAASLRMPPEGVGPVVPRIVDGLRALGVQPRDTPRSVSRLAALRAAKEQPSQTNQPPLEGPRGSESWPSDRDRSTRPRSSRVRRGFQVPAWAAAIVVVAFLIGVGWYLRPRPESLVVGVMEFRFGGDLKKEDAWMSESTRDALNTILRRVDGLNVYSKDAIDFVRKGRVSRIKAAERLGITRMISGTLVLVDSQLTLETQVTDVTTGMLHSSQRAAGPRDQLIDLQNSIALEMVRGFKLPFDEPKLLANRGATKEDLKATELYTQAFGGDVPLPVAPQPAPAPKENTSWRLTWPAEALAQSGDESAVRSVLEKYRAALEAEDLDQLSTIQEPFTEAQRTAIGRYFENAKDLKVQFSDFDILLDGDQALATFTRNDVFHDAHSGREVRLEVRMSSELAKQKDGWKIKGLKKPS